MKDVAYYQSIAGSDDYDNPERDYAREINSFVGGDGFIYQSHSFHGSAAVSKMNSLLQQAETDGKKVDATYPNSFLDEAPTIVMVPA